MNRILSILFFVLCIFCSCDKYQRIENEYLSINVPKDYINLTDSGNDVLYVVKFEDINNKQRQGGLQSILSIDNIQDNLIIPNSKYITLETPLNVLTRRLKTIKDDVENFKLRDEKAGTYWKNYLLVKVPQSIRFKEFDAAVAEYVVDEYISHLDLTVKKKIRRYVVFVNNDLWNIVISPMSVSTYDNEIKVYDKMLESISVK